MLEVLQFAFSGFWVWVGCFLMLTVVCQAIAGIVRVVVVKVKGDK